MQFSALNGIVHAGMRAAGAQLSGLMGEAIVVDVAHVTVSALEQVLPLLRLGNVKVSCIWHQVRADLHGSAMLLFHPDDSLALTCAMLGDVPSLSDAESGIVQHEALTEIANIIVSSTIIALADKLGLNIALSVPEFFEQKLGSLFDDAISDLDEGPAQVMVMSVIITAAHRPMNGTLVLVLGGGAMQRILKRLETGGAA